MGKEVFFMAIESIVNFYPCKDIEETTEFYVNIIGLTLFQDQGKARIFDSGYGYLGFCQYDHGILATQTCISFNLKDQKEVDDYYTHFKELKVEGLLPPKKHNQFDVYSFFMKDPNGYQIEFQKIEK